MFFVIFVARNKYNMNNSMSLEAVQTELIRDILNVSDVLVLEKIRKMLRREEKEVGQGTLCVADEEIPYMTKAEILANFDQACKELKLNLEGKLEFKDAEELLNEL